MPRSIDAPQRPTGAAIRLLLLAILAGSPLHAGIGRAGGKPVAPWHLGVLFWHDSPNDALAMRGIRKALAVRGHPVELTVRRCDSDEATGVRHLAAFRDEGIDLLFAMGTEAAILADHHSPGMPVVFTAVTNPVESGIVPDWTGSGKAIAGNSNWIFPETVLGLFRMAVPDLEQIGILRSSVSGVVSAAERQGMQAYLTRSDAPPIRLTESVVDDLAGIGTAVSRLVESGVDAIWIPIDYLIYENMEPVRRAARRAGVPLVSSSLKGARAGAVCGIYADYELLGERAVVIALQILEDGADPGRIPIGTMQSYRVVVNLSAARACGYELPLSLLALADTILVEAPASGDSDRRGK